MTRKPEAVARESRRTDAASELIEIVRLYRGEVYGFLRARLTEAAAAERLAENAFLQVYRARRPLRRDDVLSALLDAARTQLREHIRDSRSLGWTALCLEVEEASPERSPSDERVRAALEALDPADREVLQQTYAADRAPAGAGERLRRSESAVTQMLLRARQVLRRSLALGEVPDPTS